MTACAVLGLVLIAAGPSASPHLRVASSLPDQVMLEADWSAVSVSRGADGVLRATGPGLIHPMAIGLPDLPCVTVTVAIPPRGVVQVGSTASGTHHHTGSVSRAADSLATRTMREVPRTWHAVLTEGWLRHQRVVEVALFPVVLTSSGLISAERTTIELHIAGSGGGTTWIEPSFDAAYGAVINHEQATAWRATPPVTLSRDPTPPPEDAVKIYVNRRGICTFTGSDLQGAGIDLPDIDPATLRLTCRGQEVPFLYTGTMGGAVAPGDSLLFFAHPNYRGDPGCRLVDWWDHFTAANVYWLSWGDQPGVRFIDRAATPSGAPVVDWHVAVAHAEQDLLAFLSNTGDAPWPTEWYWRKWTAGTAGSTQNFTVTLNNPRPSQTSLLIRASLYGFSNVSGAQTQHHTQFSLNGNLFGDVTWGQWNGRVPFCYDSAAEGDIINEAWINGGTNTLGVRLLPDTDAGSLSTSYFDSWDLRYDRLLAAVQDTIEFAVPEQAGTGARTFRVENLSSPNLLVFDLVRGERLFGWQYAGTTLTFETTIGDTSHFFITSRARLVPPLKLVKERAADPPLLSGEGQASYVIISYDRESAGDPDPFHNLFDAAVDLALARDPLVPSRAVDVQDIYDAFNWGILDPDAIRNFLQYAFLTWGSTPPEHVLLFGDASWDYLGRSGPNAKRSFVPCWGYPISENYFVELSDGDVYPDLHIGRLPVEDALQADNAVARVLGYPEPYVGEQAWRKRAVMVVGGFTDTEQVQFENHAEALLEDFILPSPFLGDASRVYRSLTGYQPGYYNKRIVDAINEGCILVNYIGHGAALTWGIMFDVTDTDSLTNGLAMPVAFGLTCNSGAFGEPDTSALGETFLRLRDAADGAIGFWGATARADEASAYYGSRAFLDGLCIDLERRLGPLATAGKIAGGSVVMSMFALLGDPLVELPVPEGPDLLIQEDSLWVVPSVVGEHHDVTINAVVENQGRASGERVDVRFTAGPEGAPEETETVADTCGMRRRTRYAIPWNTGSGLGSRTVGAAADHQNAMTELQEDNNGVQILVEVLLAPPAIAAPFDCQVVTSPSVVLAVNNIPGQAAGRIYEFQIAQEDSILPASPGYQSAVVPEQQGVTSWSPPGLGSGETYFWRCKAVEGSFDGAWSLTTSVTIDSTAQGATGWMQRQGGQFAADSLWHVVVDRAFNTVLLDAQINPTDYAHVDQGATVLYVSTTNQNPYTDPLNLIGEDIGSGAGQYGQFLFANNDFAQEAVVDLGQVRSIGLLGSEHWIGVDDRPVWSYYRVSSSVDNVDFVEWGRLGPYGVPDLDNIPTPMFFDVDTPRPVRYLRFEFGQGLPHPFPSGVLWGSRVYEIFAYAVDFLASGRLTSPVIGPAVAWETLTWEADTPASTAISLTVYSAPGFEGPFAPVQGLSGLTRPPVNIGAVTDPYLRISADVSTQDPGTTPILSQWSLTLRGGVDLLFTGGLTVAPPLPPPGATAQISGVLANRGNAPADSVLLKVTDSTEDGTVTLLDTLFIALQPGGSRPFTVSWLSSIGRHIISATAEARGAAPEVAPGDNAASVDIVVLPDPAFRLLQTVTLEPQQYGSILMEGHLANLGSVASDTVAWECRARSPGGGWFAPVDSGVTMPLAPAESLSVAIAWPEPHGPGLHDVLIYVRDLDLAGQITTANDTARTTVMILTPPDLSVDSLWFSNAQPPAGDPVGVTARIRNAGEATVDSVLIMFRHQPPGDDDIPLFSSRISLTGGHAVDVATAFPTAGSPGFHRVSVVADPDDAIREVDESNNSLGDSVLVLSGVDLLCAAGPTVTLSPVLTRDTVLVSATVRNAGENSAGPFGVTWESVGLAFLGGQAVLAGLPGTSQGDIEARFLAPAVPVSSSIRLVIDEPDSVLETNEENNSAEVAVAVYSEPDLVVRGDEIRFDPSAPTEDDTVRVRFTVRNLGGVASQPFRAACAHRVAGGETWAAIGDTMFDGISAGGIVEGLALWVAGDYRRTHWFQAECNADSAAREQSLTNNRGERSLLVAPKDRDPPAISLAALLPGFQDSAWVPDMVPLGVTLQDSGSGVDTATVVLLVDGSATSLGAPDWQPSEHGMRLVGRAGPLTPGSHALRIEASDYAGNHGASRDLVVSVADSAHAVSVVAMHRDREDETVFVLRCAVSETATLTVYTTGGRLITRWELVLTPPITLLTWDRHDSDGDRVANGVYLIRLATHSGRSVTSKVALVR